MVSFINPADLCHSIEPCIQLGYGLKKGYIPVFHPFPAGKVAEEKSHVLILKITEKRS